MLNPVHHYELNVVIEVLGHDLKWRGSHYARVMPPMGLSESEAKRMALDVQTALNKIAAPNTCYRVDLYAHHQSATQICKEED